MKIAYFDCFAGISGDMCLGALVNAGVSLSLIADELKKLPIANYNLSSHKVIRGSIEATKVEVALTSTIGYQASEGSKFADILRIIKASAFHDKIKESGIRIFKQLFEAEAEVHGELFDNVHLHELGGIDCLVDVFGTLIGIDALGIEKTYVSSINLGSGSVMSDHGRLPVPAPATAELLKGYPVYSNGSFELTTPTGAAIIKGVGSSFSALPEMQIERIGYGAGSKDPQEFPNALRIFIGNESVSQKVVPSEMMVVMETNIDDMNPQLYEEIMERLFAAGALDIFLDQVIMKKVRPGIKMSILCRQHDQEKIAKIIFEETTTIGIRFYQINRMTLDREFKAVVTRFGEVRLKIARFGDKIMNISPEYEDVKLLAKKHNLPMKKIIAEISKDYSFE